ncbi:hypothetical protein M434DRAFT_387095 [Hypoxylon sp. CO27-5]|nr:hypothetical protein M434DRAFT_387095 [Hypoxylon sp. CO27-5]
MICKEAEIPELNRISVIRSKFGPVVDKSIIFTTTAMSGDEEALQLHNKRNYERKVGFRDRITHFTWANFTCTQSTGGIAILLSTTPHQFQGLQTAGVVVFIMNIILFLILCAMMLTRFILHPQMLKRSFTNPPELFFFGSFWLSIATSIIFTLIYTVVAWVVSAALSHIKPLQINPAVFLMIFNTMLTGTMAAAIAQSQPPVQRLPIIVAGVAYQGLGWIVSMMLLPFFIGSVLSNGLGTPSQRPGLFMPVGSSGYTIVSLIGCARHIPRGYGFFERFTTAADVLQVIAVWVGIFLWLFAFWLFAIALVANIPVMIPNRHLQPRMSFSLSWWGIVFPNVGFTIATIMIGEELQSNTIQWVGTIMTILLFAAWLMGLGLHFKTIVTGQIMWPGKDEDIQKST